MAQELCFLKAVVLNSHGPDMSVFAFAMELFRRMCIFSFAGGYPVKHSCISAWFRNIFMLQLGFANAYTCLLDM